MYPEELVLPMRKQLTDQGFSELKSVHDVDETNQFNNNKEQQRRKKIEEWSCKTLRDWIKLAEKRGHNQFWAKKRWELRKKQKPKNNYNDDQFFGF